MENFKIGEVVELKSGGPKMTVEAEVGPLMVKCVWFQDTKLHRGEFKKELLNRSYNRI